MNQKRYRELTVPVGEDIGLDVKDITHDTFDGKATPIDLGRYTLNDNLGRRARKLHTLLAGNVPKLYRSAKVPLLRPIVHLSREY